MDLRVLPATDESGGWQVCSDCPAPADVELEEHDTSGHYQAFCMGCLILKLLWLRALFATRREPAQAAGAGIPPGS